MPTVLVTGANRGLGLCFARQYAAAGWRVLATCRDPDAADALKELAGVVLHRFDVASSEQIAELAATLGGEPIDVLIHNAGVAASQGYSSDSNRSISTRHRSRSASTCSSNLASSSGSGTIGSERWWRSFTGRGTKVGPTPRATGTGRCSFS